MPPAAKRPVSLGLRLAGLSALALIVVAITCAVAASGTSVDWTHYSPSVKIRIDKAAASQDCSVLQHEFDTAAGNNIPGVRETTDLMSYVESKMQDAGCEG